MEYYQNPAEDRKLLVKDETLPYVIFLSQAMVSKDQFVMSALDSFMTTVLAEFPDYQKTKILNSLVILSGGLEARHIPPIFLYLYKISWVVNESSVGRHRQLREFLDSFRYISMIVADTFQLRADQIIEDWYLLEEHMMTAEHVERWTSAWPE
jgi:hypothetical protein